MSTRAVKRKKAEAEAEAEAAVATATAEDDVADDDTVQEDDEELAAVEANAKKRAKPSSTKEEAVDDEAATASAPLAVLEEAAAAAAALAESNEDATAAATNETEAANPAEAAAEAEDTTEALAEGAVAAVAAAAAAAAEEEEENGTEEAAPTTTTTAKKGMPAVSRAKPKLKTRNSSTSENAVGSVLPARKLNTAFPSHLNPTDMGDFDHFLFQLLASRAENSLSNFTVHKDEYPLLYAWLQFLKKEYKAYTTNGDVSQLSAQQVAVLESLHVPLTSRGDDHWNRFYDLLVSYKARHGHVLVPRLCEVPGLGDWVTDQRRQYKAKQQGQATQLTDPRQEKLDAIDFVWHVRNRPEWDLRYAELLQYKAEHGDCKVPQHYKPNKALGKWVAKQREQYKLLQKKQHSFLTPYRQEKLNTAGFVWVVRAGMDTDAVAAAAAAAAVTTPRAKSEGGDDEDAAAAGAAGTASDAGKITASDFPTDAAAAAEGEEDAVKVDPEAMEQEEKEAETKEVYNV